MHVRGINRDDGGRLAVQRCELDLEHFAVAVGVNDRPDSADFQASLWHSLREYDSVQLFRHKRRRALRPAMTRRQAHGPGATLPPHVRDILER